MPLSSKISRRTASSMVSAASTKPARQEYMPGGKCFWRPSRHFSPDVTSMITTGSVRGKCSALQFGTHTAMKEGGWKRECPNCKAEHFPRTDPVVIMLVTSGEKCLLGRQKHFPPGMYSCLAGFVEAAETIEDAVRREIFEESGIRCTDVSYYMTQPWPYPSSLMIGCAARATSEDIIVDRTELEDARWFDRAEAMLMLKREHPDGLAGPHPFAIAHHLVGRWLQIDLSKRA